MIFNIQAAGQTAPMLSPCVGICELDATGFCIGCHRSGSEIAQWTAFSNDQRQFVMDVLLPARELKK
jgi:uncharacterized protein